MNTSTTSHTIRVAIIGGGFGALMTYATLRFRGLGQEEIAIYAPDSSPEQSWGRYARAINLHSLRSESGGHFYPTDSPGLATIESWQTWSLRPLVQSWFDRYHPAVDSFIHHTKNVARQTGFYRRLVPVMIGRIERLDGWFALYDTNGQFLIYAQHVVLAVGHGLHNIPAPVAAFREQHPNDSRVVLSYEQKTYAPPRTVLVVGDGLTAGTEWVNVLETGGTVIGVSIQGFSFGQALNCPRPYLSRLGLKPYRNQSPEARVEEIKMATRGTIPRYPRWKKLLRTARKTGRLIEIQGTLIRLTATGDNQVEAVIELPDNMGSRTIPVDQLISATGFMPPVTNPLLKQLVERYQLPTMSGFLKVTDQCYVPALSMPNSYLTTVGSAAVWAFPCADQLSGLKLAARQVAGVIVGPERWSPRALFEQTNRWATLMAGGELV
jgi:hypothetical protein